MRRKLKIKTGDIVKVIAGNQKGTQGKVLRVFANKNRAIVEGVNVVKKHNKPNANNPKGGITEKELSIDISNISLITSDGQPTRVGFKIENDKKVRFSKKSNAQRNGAKSHLPHRVLICPIKSQLVPSDPRVLKHQNASLKKLGETK